MNYNIIFPTAFDSINPDNDKELQVGYVAVL